MRLRFVTHLDPRSRFIKLVSHVLKYTYVKVNYLHTGAFYFTLGNLSPKYRSKLSSIYLLALVKSKFISEYGMDAVLKPILDDIKKLVYK